MGIITQLDIKQTNNMENSKATIEEVKSILDLYNKYDWFCSKLTECRNLTIEEWHEQCDSNIEFFACCFNSRNELDSIKKLQLLSIAKSGIYLDYNQFSNQQINELNKIIVKANTERNIKLNKLKQ